MGISPKSIEIIEKLINKVQQELSTTKNVRLDQLKNKELRKLLDTIGNKDEQYLLVLGHTIATLKYISLEKNKVDSEYCDPNYENWMNLVLDHLIDFNKYDNCYISSCGEAIYKTFGLRRYLNNKGTIYFRGEHIYGRSLIPRIVRTTGLQYNKSDPLQPTSEELYYLSKFRKKYIRYSLKRHLISKKFNPNLNLLYLKNPTWWSVMAHYDDQVGTRMIDITSSIFCGLYFACVNWDGNINYDNDGCLYFIWDHNWRTANDDPKITSTSNYYKIQSSPHTTRFRESPHSNERQIYQDGFFLWQPNFSDPLNLSNVFKFRIHKDSKIDILKELYAIGYTAKRIVRRNKGKEAHAKICTQLGIEP